MNNATIWKFDITDTEEIEIPSKAQFLKAMIQNHRICLWFLVTPTNPKQKRSFRIIGTGYSCDSVWWSDYLDTVMTEDHSLVWHIFEVV